MKSNHHFRKISWNPQKSSCIGAIFLAVKIKTRAQVVFVEFAKFFQNIFLVENLSVIVSVSYALGIEIFWELTYSAVMDFCRCFARKDLESTTFSIQASSNQIQTVQQQKFIIYLRIFIILLTISRFWASLNNWTNLTMFNQVERCI